jgi:hypothetical protein
MKYLSLFYRGIYILVTVATLLMGLRINGNYLLVYYTTQSNILCFLFFLFYFIHGLLKRETTKPIDLILRIKGAITLCIAVTSIIFTVLSGSDYVSLKRRVLNYICPVMVFLDYLFFDEKGKYKPQDPFLWLIIPALYVVFALVRGFLGGEIGDTGSNFPYSFLDPTSTGLGVYMSALYVAVMLIAFLILGYIIFAIDRILARKHKDKIK